jgi:hypothetical protein
MKYLRFILLTAIAVITLLILAACASGGAHHHKQSLAPDVQAQLGALQLPQGVDPAVFTQLKDAFAKAMQERGKTASTPPEGLGNAPENASFTDDGGGLYTLQWEYRNLGDYAQDGTVGVADITPLAAHYGHSHTTDGLDAVIDLDNNGVGISDVTPIAQHFGVNCAGYDIAWQDGAAWTPITSVNFNQATGGTAGWKSFSHQYAASTTGWHRIMAFDGEGNRSAANTLIINGTAGPNITDVQPQTGQTGSSYSPVVSYTGDTATSAAWDFGGGATPNTTTDINPSVTLNAAGDYNASVTLTNAIASDTFNFTLTVTPAGGITWNVHQISNYGDLGYTSSLASIDNRPAIAFVDELAPTTLYYARSTVMCPISTSDWIFTTVASNPGSFYQGISLAAKSPENVPVILTNDVSTTAAVYLQASSSSPSGPGDWNASAIDTGVLETGTIVPIPLSVSYLTSSGLTLALASVNLPTGPADWDKVLIDATAGHDSKLKMLPSSPYGAYITHYEDTSEALMLSWCTESSILNAASWTTFQASVSSGDFSGLYHDLAFDAFGKLLVNYTREDGGTGLTIVSGGISNLEPADIFGFTFYTASDSPTEARGANLSFDVGYDNAYCAYGGGGGFSTLYLSYVPHTSGSTPFSWNLLTVDDVSPGDVRDTGMLVYTGDASSEDWVGISYLTSDGLYFASAVIP